MPSRFTIEQIIGILREREVGGKILDVCGKHGISTATFYKWKAKYGGLEVSDPARLTPEAGKVRPSPAALGLLAHLRGKGATVTAAAGKIHVSPAALLNDVDRRLITEHREALLRLLDPNADEEF